jgi:hypothetical protein
MRVSRPQRTRHPWRWTAAFGLLVALVVGLIVGTVAVPPDSVEAATFTVNVDLSGDDAPAVATAADCGLGAPVGSLCDIYDALAAANATAANDTINFNIPGTGPHIQDLFLGPGTPLTPGPVAASGTVTFDASGETACGFPHCVVLTRSGGAPVSAFVLGTSGTTVRDFVINNFAGGPAIAINGPAATGNTIADNYIGIDITGTVAVPNLIGVSLGLAPAGSTANTIGGTTSTARNVISGNAAGGIIFIGVGTNGNFVRSNYIGTDATGSFAIPNPLGGVIVGFGAPGPSGNIIGSPGNLISGNSPGPGVWVNGEGTTGNVVRGNYIGTNSTGSVAIPNNIAGVLIQNGPDSTAIGGTAAADGNVISGNSGAGVAMIDNDGNALTTTTNNRVQGNIIGTAADAATALPNSAGPGVAINTLGSPGGDSASVNTVGGNAAGAANLIANNAADGVNVGEAAGTAADGNVISRNDIDTNGGCGINLSPGIEAVPPVLPSPNGETIPPAITSISGPTGTSYSVTVAGNVGATVEIFEAAAETNPACNATGNSIPVFPNVENPAISNGEGACFLGSGTVGAGGTVTIVVDNIGNKSITADQTVAGPGGGTSEFADNFGAPPGPSAACVPAAPAATATPTTGPTSTPTTAVATSTPTSAVATSTPTSVGPTATPTLAPLETVALVFGCNFVTSTYPDDSQPATLAAAVSPQANLDGLWAQQPPPTWRGYNPLFPAASDMLPVDRLEVIAICMTGSGTWERPPL